MATTCSETNAARWVLFQRDDCGLCDQALALLAAVHAPEFVSVFVDDNPGLEARYGTRVPVLRHNEDGGMELDWPFDAARLRALFDTCERTPI